MPPSSWFNPRLRSIPTAARPAGTIKMSGVAITAMVSPGAQPAIARENADPALLGQLASNVY